MSLAASQTPQVPPLRFPEYTGNWSAGPLEEFITRVGDPISVDQNKLYREIGIRSHGKGIFHKEPVVGKTLGNKRVFKVHVPAFVINIVFAWEHAIAITTDDENGLIASHRFPMFVPVKNMSTLSFVKHFFLRKHGKHLLELASPGGAGRNKTLGQKNFNKLKVVFPSISEQQKISSFLSSMDRKIEQLSKKKTLIEKYKKGIMQKIFSQEFRFKDAQGNAFPDWGKRQLADILDYQQPTSYLVASVKYDDNYTIPVLTAGKKFVLGYTNETTGIFKENLPTIIFDDFTTAFKFVDFPFKAKSSAMKMLVPKNDKVNLGFVHASMQQICFPLGVHKRHWISEYQWKIIGYPSSLEQQKITDYLFSINQKIDLVSSELDHAKTFKKGLLQQMFI